MLSCAQMLKNAKGAKAFGFMAKFQTGNTFGDRPPAVVTKTEAGPGAGPLTGLVRDRSVVFRTPLDGLG